MRSLLRRLGFEVTRTPAPHTMDWNVRQLFRHRSIDLVIDVGAHHGEFAVAVRECGYAGQIESFEPFSNSFVLLGERMRSDSNWSGHQVAAGSEAGNLSLNVYAGTDFNSALSPSALGLQRFSLVSSETETVRVVRLDETIESGSRILLKTDTQGFDLEVIEGAFGLMGNVQAILVELSIRPIYEGSPTMLDMVEVLGGLGFLPQAFVPVSRDRGFDVIEFDALFLRP